MVKESKKERAYLNKSPWWKPLDDKLRETYAKEHLVTLRIGING